jgi:hypothetical protein
LRSIDAATSRNGQAFYSKFAALNINVEVKIAIEAADQAII